MAQGTGRPGQILGVSVTLVSYPADREADLAVALKEIMPDVATLTQEVLPLLVLDSPSSDKAEWAYDLLEAAGGEVAIAREWMDRDSDTARPTCPSCGSENGQPYLHAGPAARVNRKCNDCGHLFKVKTRS